MKPPTDVFRVFYTSAHFGRVVRPWEFVLCTGQRSTASVEYLQDSVNFEHDLIRLYLPLDGRMGAPASRNYFETSGRDSLYLVLLQVEVSQEQRTWLENLLAYDTSATLSLL